LQWILLVNSIDGNDRIQVFDTGESTPPPTAGVLFGTNQNGNVFTIDHTTGAATVLGNYFEQGSFAEIECPEFSLDCFITTGGSPFAPNRKTIAPINLSGVPTIGAPSPAFALPLPGLEYVGNTLYASDTNGNLYIITNPVTGATTLIGTMGAGFCGGGEEDSSLEHEDDCGFRMSGLAYDTANGIMYGMNGISADLYTVDLTDASVTFIGNTGTGEVGGMEFGPDGLLYGGGNACASEAPNLPWGGAGDIFTINYLKL